MSSGDPRFAGSPGTPEPAICAFCGAERHTEGRILLGAPIWRRGSPMPCQCPEGKADWLRMEAEAEAERLAWRKEAADAAMRRRARRIAGESGMGERFLQRTFRTFEAETAEQRKFKAVAQAYARTFDDRLPKRGEPLPGRNGLVISGTKGTGKTHMAAAIANEIMSRGTAVICMTERNLLGRIKQAYSPAGRADENAVRAMYERVPLLAIDDLGKEKATEWTLSTLYAIIDARYERAMPLIVTTNYGARGLAERLTPKGEDKTTADAILDRLSEMCESIVTGGESWRARQ